jgi:CRP/FNR family transcriptional regulator
MEVPAGVVLFHEGQRCDGFYFVEAGRMKIYRLAPDGRERIVHHVGAGQSFAEAALFHFGMFPASAAPVDGPATLLRIDGARFLQLLQDERALGASMLGSLCGWLHVLLDRIEVLTLISAGSRLATFLLRLPARDVGGELRVQLPVPKKDLASELSITPETLSRLLARWRDRGLIRVEGRSVALLDPRTLETLAEASSAE